MQFGKSLVGYGKIPAGSDASSLWHVFQAGEKPVAITNGTFWGGDGTEIATLYIAPPGVLANGGQSPADYGGSERNTIAVFSTITGGEKTNVFKGAMFGNFTRTASAIGFYVPPNWVVMVAANAANTASWKFSIQGFELE